MPESSPARPWARRVMDLVVFAPLGLVTSAREEVPALAARGRERFELQVRNARIVGELVVSEGRKELERRFGGGNDSASTPSRPVPPGRIDDVEGAAGKESVTAAAGEGLETTPPSAPVDGDLRSSEPPGPTDALSSGVGRIISDYDTLSASQVVRRLDGLSPGELEGVRRYEAAGRRRRTILSRVDELTGHVDGGQRTGET